MANYLITDGLVLVALARLGTASSHDIARFLTRDRAEPANQSEIERVNRVTRRLALTGRIRRVAQDRMKDTGRPRNVWALAESPAP